MLAFDVINLEQHRALQQNAAKVYLPRFCGSHLLIISWPSSSCKLLKLNRQILKLERHVTYREQTTETCSNRQKIQKCARPISKSANFLSRRDFDNYTSGKIKPPTIKDTLFLRSGSATSNRFWPKNRSNRKQTIKPCLTGSRIAWIELAISSDFRITVASLCGLKSSAWEEPPRSIFQCSNLSRPHGRS